MTLRHWIIADRRQLADAAAAERNARAKAYPAMVASRAIGDAEAEADYQAWAAIADWCAGKDLPGWATMADLIAAAAASLDRREAELRRAPADKRAAITARRDAGHRIHAMLVAAAESAARITAELRAEIEAERSQAA